MKLFPRRPALIAATTTIAALAIPAAASATVVPVSDGQVLTVTSDDAADTITLGAAGGVLTVNGAATTVVADDTALIRIQAGGGSDTVDASALAVANYGGMDISGGAGDDLVTGGTDVDVISGDAGDDRLIGFRGGDDVAGGDGNDTMVWNNGDGTDVNNGNGGNDEVEVNGAPTAGDQMTVRPGDQPGRVQFNRTNLGTFGIDLTAERLTVNTLGGDDVVGNDGALPPGLAGLTSLTLNGGSGSDILNGSDGADTVNGGENADIVNGGPGDDRVSGDRGSDTHQGGDGDDVLVWNNGDGSDDVNGGAGFDTSEVNGSPTGGDDFRLAPDGARAVFARANLVPFTIAIDENTEAVAVSGGTGNDALAVSAGLARLFVAAEGGSGNDVLTGGDEADTFLGGTGSDLLAPGPGSDLADGGADDDELATRDDVGDLVRGGPGEDAATTDSVQVDATSEVENHDATPIPEPPAADTRALLPELGKVTVRRQGKRNLVARVPLTCPAAEAGGCATTVTLETAKAVRLGPVRAPLVLGSATADLASGQEATVAVRLARGTARLAKRGRLATRVRVTSSDGAGNLATDQAAVGLRIP